MGNKYQFIYRVFKLNEWEIFKKNKNYQGNKLDFSSGFIHLSTRNQLRETIKLYFYKYEKIAIVEFKLKNLKKHLKWENSRNKEFFPHYYGILKFEDVHKVKFLGNRRC